MAYFMRLVESNEELHLTNGSRENNILTLEVLGFKAIEYPVEEISSPHAIVAMVDDVIQRSEVFYTLYHSENSAIERLVQFPPDMPSNVVIRTNIQRYTNQALLKYTGDRVEFGRTLLFSVANNEEDTKAFIEKR